MSAAVLFPLRLLGMLLYWTGLYHLVLRWNRRTPRILLYHACDSCESDFTRDLDSNVTPASFERHLDFLARHYNVVPLSAVEAGSHPDHSAIITFDDGYRSVYTNAYSRLKARGFPATVFLVSSVVGNSAMVWVNELNWLLRNRAATTRDTLRTRLAIGSTDTPRQIINRTRAMLNQAQIDALLAELRERLAIETVSFAREANLYVSWDEIAAMTSGGIRFGNHTATHPSLPRLNRRQQALEMRLAQEALEKRLGAVTSIAYPFGDRDTESREAAIELGFVSIMEVGGSNNPLNLHAVSRTPIEGWDNARLFAELEIVAPVKARARSYLKLWRGAGIRVATPSTPASGTGS